MIICFLLLCQIRTHPRQGTCFFTAVVQTPALITLPLLGQDSQHRTLEEMSILAHGLVGSVHGQRVPRLGRGPGGGSCSCCRPQDAKGEEQGQKLSRPHPHSPPPTRARLLTAFSHVFINRGTTDGKHPRSKHEAFTGQRVNLDLKQKTKSFFTHM